MKRQSLLAAVPLLMPPLSAAAQAPASAPQAERSCELHIVPAVTVISRTEGIVKQGILFRRKGDATDSSALMNAIDATTQGSLMGAADIPSQLGIPPAKIVIEKPADGSHGRPKGRQSKSSADCYYELQANYISAFKTWMANTLTVEFALYDYTGKPERRVFQRVMRMPLKLFPPKPGEDLLAANDEVVAAFKTALSKFTDASRPWMSKAASTH